MEVEVWWEGRQRLLMPLCVCRDGRCRDKVYTAFVVARCWRRWRSGVVKHMDHLSQVQKPLECDDLYASRGMYAVRSSDLDWINSLLRGKGSHSREHVSNL